MGVFQARPGVNHASAWMVVGVVLLDAGCWMGARLVGRGCDAV